MTTCLDGKHVVTQLKCDRVRGEGIFDSFEIYFRSSNPSEPGRGLGSWDRVQYTGIADYSRTTVYDVLAPR
jgi:hypothetical protein